MTLLQQIQQLSRRLSLAGGRAGHAPSAAPRRLASLPQIAPPEPATCAERSGFIGPEPRLEVPFEIASGDGELKVVVFSDPPGLLSLAIELADGARLDASSAAGYGAAIAAKASLLTCTFAAGGRVPAGPCRAILTVDTRLFKEYLMEVRLRFPREFARLASSGLFYSVSVLACRAPAVPAAWRRSTAEPAERPNPRRTGQAWPPVRLAL